ncbi:hypothetical protein [Peribacillus frigoritolerans]|uniref:hypothetical protein n=1 Tax=Peribacillus frigoritolerans TaxID=450367 RepID=UPI00315D93D9
MKLSIRDILESKGISATENHLPILKTRWQAIENLKSDIDNAALNDYDISLRNIPGGDHIE